ncbi:MAG: hypothetical protein P4L33_07170 [Capsulimonadaceae bacterium]|nr:hypothetical protein [Capsulimonadaceae bacterium]
MNTNNKIIAAFAIAALLTAGAGTVAQAHDSNTLHKLGKAIQYPVRKAGENLDVDIHRSEHKKSVEVDRNRHEKFVIKPNGQKVFKSNYGSYHHHYRHHHARTR